MDSWCLYKINFCDLISKLGEEDRMLLCETGIPVYYGIFEPLQDLTLITTPSSEYVCFFKHGCHQLMGIEVSTGHVKLIADFGEDSHAMTINTSLQKYCQTCEFIKLLSQYIDGSTNSLPKIMGYDNLPQFLHKVDISVSGNLDFWHQALILNNFTHPASGYDPLKKWIGSHLLPGLNVA